MLARAGRNLEVGSSVSANFASGRLRSVGRRRIPRPCHRQSAERANSCQCGAAVDDYYTVVDCGPRYFRIAASSAFRSRNPRGGNVYISCRKYSTCLQLSVRRWIAADLCGPRHGYPATRTVAAPGALVGNIRELRHEWHRGMRPPRPGSRIAHDGAVCSVYSSPGAMYASLSLETGDGHPQCRSNCRFNHVNFIFGDLLSVIVPSTARSACAVRIEGVEHQKLGLSLDAQTTATRFHAAHHRAGSSRQISTSCPAGVTIAPRTC